MIVRAVTGRSSTRALSSRIISRNRRGGITGLHCITTAAAKAPTPSSEIPFILNEPQGPRIAQSYPGSRGQDAINRLGKVFDTVNLNLIADYWRSVGNYLADADSNLYLDVYCQIASMPVGYNNQALIAAVESPSFIRAVVNRAALGSFPDQDWDQTLRAGLLAAAPRGLDQVFTTSHGSDANETAYKAAFMYRRALERGGRGVDFKNDELISCMENQAPGSPDLSILSFRNGFHGRLFGTLSTTRSRPLHKMDIPAFDWPCAPFPEIKYPLADYREANAEEESRCLFETERIITTSPKPPAAIIVEPILAEGGDKHASASFFSRLRDLATKHSILFIVDEVQTGVGVTGAFWAHEHWHLSKPPDIVTFAKKAQAAGWYYRDPNLRPQKSYRQYNTWMGDESRVILFNAIFAEIQRLDLVENARRVGAYLMAGLTDISLRYGDVVQNLRGQGTFIAWDSPRRDEFLALMRKHGVLIGGCGLSSVRLRPMLVFQESHARIFLDTVQRVLAQMSRPGA